MTPRAEAAVLSRHPISETHAMEIPDETMHRRGCTAVVETALGRLPILSAGLWGNVKIAWHRRVIADRPRPYRTIVRHLESVESELPPLVGADLNAEPDSGELRRPAVGRRATQCGKDQLQGMNIELSSPQNEGPRRGDGEPLSEGGFRFQDAPGSKSITARALFLAAAARGTTVLHRPLVSDDTVGFAEGLARLGYRLERTQDRWSVEGRARGPVAEEASVFCRDGATTARFLPVLAAAGHGVFRFDASAQMRRRPLGPLTRALRSLGVTVIHEEREGHHPLTVRADGIKGGHVTLDAGLSSQFLTALLLVGPLTEQGLAITVTDLVSAPYVDITVAMMESFGVRVHRDGDTFTVPAQPYPAIDYAIEPDASTAGYFLAAAALTGRRVTVPGLGSRSLQGDLRFAQVLARMGAQVTLTEDHVTVTGAHGGRLAGITVNMRDISDTVPTLAAIAPFADGPVRIEDVYNTRIKECDRLEACAENLRALGVPVQVGRDWIEIHPSRPRPAHIACHGDHRIAMAFSVTGLRTPGITLDDPGCVKKTFPGFHRALDDLRKW
ncbi:3-phosphoshikimate 1-carboxyvinyltransferase [Streptomyces malaysiensis subsp. malaysiensis]|nr:3-phosphoshikimate 1-carboxyvinyltransferase [Streptomyces sp. M56]